METSLRRALSRDVDAAFPELLSEHQATIYSVALRFTGDAQDARDVTQDVFIRAYRALRRYEPDRIRELKLRAWLWTIAANECRNRARSRARRPSSVSLDRVPEPAGSPSDPVIGPALEIALRTLPERRRLAVVLRHVAALSTAEVAEALDCPEGTVKSDVARGLAQLRAELEEDSP